jgi:plastocyanin
MRFSVLLLLPSLVLAHEVRGKVARELVASFADAIVYVAEVPGRRFPPPAEPEQMEQRGQSFVPHVLPVVRGTRVRFPNNDRIRHNVFSPAGAQPFNFGIYPPGSVKELTFDALGVVMLLCNIHENMSAFIVVLQNPFFARVGGDGRFKLPGVPEGNYALTLWVEGRTPVVRKISLHGDLEVEFR